MTKSKKKKMNRNLLLSFKILGIICFLFIVCFLFFLGKLNVLPMMYFIIISLVFGIIGLVSVLSIFKFKKSLKIFS